MRGLTALLMAASLIACSDDADRRQLLGGRSVGVDGTDPEGQGPGGGGGEDDAGTQGPGPSPTDAGTTVDSGTTVDAFTGAPPYVNMLGPSARKAGHAAFNAEMNPAGRPCRNCHDGNGNAPEFTVAGTVYKDLAGTAPSPRVEIRVVDKNGKAVSVYSDPDGNYFLPLNPNGALAMPVLAGARKANGARTMISTAANGNCNSCHRNNGAAGGRLFMP